MSGEEHGGPLVPGKECNSTDTFISKINSFPVLNHVNVSRGRSGRKIVEKSQVIKLIRKPPSFLLTEGMEVLKHGPNSLTFS